MPRKLALRGIALGYLAVLLLAPLSMIFYRTFEAGLEPIWQALSDPNTIHAFKVTLEAAAIAVPVNTIFGVLCGLLIVRRRFPGKGILNAFIDLPLAISPVVVGLCLYLLWAETGWFGDTRFGPSGTHPVLFALPGIVLATIFVSVPFVAREVIPTLRELGTEQEQAAATLGASRWQRFWRITLPSIRWAIVYGVVLTTARCLGEYGAVALVSGRIEGQTETAAVRVESYASNFDTTGAYAVSLVLALIAVVVLIAMTLIKPREAPLSIEVRNIKKRFGDFVAVDDVSLEIPDGSLTAVLGPSGSGKSTLLRIIAGLERADSGEVLLEGKDATALSPQNRDVGFVFQHYAAFKHMTVRDNVGFALSIRKRPKREIRARVDELLDLVQLNGYADRYPHKLSGGQRQRMALARALAAQPRVLLLDEPFGALDARVRAELRDWLRRLHEEVHVTTVFVTHDQEEAMEVADRVAVLNHGRLEQVGNPTELYDNPASEFVLRFLGDAFKLGGVFVRPHELRLQRFPKDGAVEVEVERLVVVGADVRIELVDGSGERMTARLRREDVEDLELEAGEIVWATAEHSRSVVSP